MAALAATMMTGTALQAQATPAGSDDGRAMGPRRTDKEGIALGISGGVTFPVGDTRDRAPTGWNVGAHLDLGRNVGPFGLRLEGGYHGFADSDIIETTGPGTTLDISNKYSIANAGVALTFGIPGSWSAVRPYLIGGVGAYWLRNAPQCVNGGQSCPPGDARLSVAEDWRLGLNGGAGIEFGIGDLSAFVEGRYHHALSGLPSAACLRAGTCTDRSPAQLVPVKAGLLFRF
jgi:hypothetical protein